MNEFVAGGPARPSLGTGMLFDVGMLDCPVGFLGFAVALVWYSHLNLVSLRCLLLVGPLPHTCLTSVIWYSTYMYLPSLPQV